MRLRLKFWKCWISSLLYRLSDDQTKDTIICDMNRYVKFDESIQNKKTMTQLKCVLLKHREFRNIFYMRVKKPSFLISLSKLFLSDLKTIEITQSGIGAGFMISHHYAVVAPQSAGRNLRIGPGVVVGKNGRGKPVIGNNVYIGANSTVIGDITIGDNVIIGAGSVVTKDLPGNGVYAGNPARLIRHIDDDPRLLLEIM